MAPNETAAEDVRNALQLLADAAEGIAIQRSPGAHHVMCNPAASIHAAKVRLESALAKLDATTAEERAIGRREHELGIMQDRADDVAPLDYVQPGQVDPVLRGQEMSEDGE